MRINRFIITTLFLLSSSLSLFAIQLQDEGDLNKLMTEAAEVFNNGDHNSLVKYLADDFTLITMDNMKYSSLEEFKEAYDFFFNSGESPLIGMSVIPNIDGTPFFMNDNAVLLNGTAHETYYFADATVRSLTTRWTAVALKVNDEWKIKQLHFSSNIFDNPVVNELKSQLYDLQTTSH